MKKGIFLLLVLLQCLTLEGTVICIHGFLTSARSMKPIENSLKACGFEVCNWQYESRRRTIQQHACDLAAYLRALAACQPDEPIDFVTHSTGALILRAALNLSECPEEAKTGRAVLLAPPNQGSSLGRRFKDVPPVTFFMGGKSGWQLMNWDACSVQNCLGAFPETMQVLVIAGTNGNCLLFDEPNDGYLTVEETRLETPHDWTSYPVNHGNILVDPKVLCCMRSFLVWGGAEEPETPRQSD